MIRSFAGSDSFSKKPDLPVPIRPLNGCRIRKYKYFSIKRIVMQLAIESPNQVLYQVYPFFVYVPPGENIVLAGMDVSSGSHMAR